MSRLVLNVCVLYSYLNDDFSFLDNVVKQFVAKLFRAAVKSFQFP